MEKQLGFQVLIHQKQFIIKNIFNYVILKARRSCAENCQKKKLIEKINNKKIHCEREKQKDRWGRTLAECFVNNESLSRYLVKNGYAFDFKKYSKNKFSYEQKFAKDNKLGLWSMEFIYPWEWRSRVRKYMKDKSLINDIKKWTKIR